MVGKYCLQGYFYVPSEIFALQKKLPHLEFAQTHLCPKRDINLTPADNKGRGVENKTVVDISMYSL